MKPAVAADRKRVRPLGAVVVGADLGTSRHAGDVFSDPDKTAGSDLIAGSRAALDKRDTRGLQRRRFRPHPPRSEEHTSELQSRFDLVCRLLLEKKKKFIQFNQLRYTYIIN